MQLVQLRLVVGLVHIELLLEILKEVDLDHQLFVNTFCGDKILRRLRSTGLRY